VRAVLVWLHGFKPGRMRVNGVERLRACGGALIGIFLTAAVSRMVLGSSMELPLLIAPMGASAVLLFSVPASPLAQPWSILGGNVISAAIGVTCVIWIPDLTLAAAVAVAGAIGAMFALRCLHPPGGAIALAAVMGGPVIHDQGYLFLLSPVGINSLLLLAVAIAFNNATRRRYLHPPQLNHGNTHNTNDVRPGDRIGFTPADMHIVELVPLLSDIGLHHIPIINAERRLAGMVTQSDLIAALYRGRLTDVSGTA